MASITYTNRIERNVQTLYANDVLQTEGEHNHKKGAPSYWGDRGQYSVALEIATKPGNHVNSCTHFVISYISHHSLLCLMNVGLTRKAFREGHIDEVFSTFTAVLLSYVRSHPATHDEAYAQ